MRIPSPEDRSGAKLNGVDVHLHGDGTPRFIERRFVKDIHSQSERLDLFLKARIPRLSRNKLQQLIKSQQVLVGGKRAKANTLVHPGIEIVMKSAARPEPPCPRYFDLLYEDSALMVICKPAGLPAHSSARYYFNTLTRVLLEQFPDEHRQICHRLDRETSGVLVVAKSSKDASAVKQCFEAHRMRKSYLAIVRGVPNFKGSETIDLALGLVADPQAKIDIRMVARKDGLPSQTEVAVLAHSQSFALVRCRPITGRQHQIRAHLAAIGYPIVGDKLYAHGDEVFMRCCDTGIDKQMRQLLLLERHALHAAEIEFPHPREDRNLVVRAPLPADMRDFLIERRICDSELLDLDSLLS